MLAIIKAALIVFFVIPLIALSTYFLYAAEQMQKKEEANEANG